MLVKTKTKTKTKTQQGDAHPGLRARGPGGGGAGGVPADEAGGAPAGLCACVCVCVDGFWLSFGVPLRLFVSLAPISFSHAQRFKNHNQKQDLAVCTAVLEALARHHPTPSSSPASSTSSSIMGSKKDRVLDFWMEMRLHGVEPDAVVRACSLVVYVL